MRIAVVLPALTISGGVSVAVHYARELAYLHDRVDVINISGIECSNWISPGNARIVTTTPEGISSLELGEYDWAIGTFWTTVHQIRSGLVNARRSAYLIQGDEEQFYAANEFEVRESVRSTYVGPEIKIVISEWLLNVLRSRYSDQTFTLIRNGIDFERFARSRPLMEKGSRLRVLVEGSIMSPLKRVRETLALLKLFDGLEVWLVSSDAGSVTGVNPDLSFFSVPYSAMPKIYSSCHILVKNSWTEGFSLPLLEMMASGGVPVANSVGPTKNIITHNVNGFVYDSICEESLSNAFSLIHGNFESISRNAISTAESYRWLSQVDELRELLVKNL